MAVAVAPAEVGFSAEFVALLFAFLFLWLAITVLDAIRPALVGLAGAVPLVGGALRSAVESGIGALRGYLYGYLSQSLIAYGTLLHWLDTLWTATANMALDWVALDVAAIFRLRTVVIPAYAASVTTWAQAQFAAANAFAQASAVAAENLARSLVAAEHAAAVALFEEARVEAARLVAAEHAAAQGLFAVAEQDAARLAEAERAYVVGQVLGVEAEIKAAFRQATAISAAAEATLRGDIGAVQQELSGSIRQEVDGLLKQIEADKEALSAALAGGLAAVVADVAAIRALRCIQRCAELGALGEALQIINLAAILALVELILHDGPTFRREWLAGVQPLITDTVAGVRSALGV
jgi:hypothetical protein